MCICILIFDINMGIVNGVFFLVIIVVILYKFYNVNIDMIKL